VCSEANISYIFAVISVKSLSSGLETGEMRLGKLPLAQVAKLRWGGGSAIPGNNVLLER